ncbi:AAA family ATPase, partial [bacterium]|nr:AAA family ATPase [bacterium]
MKFYIKKIILWLNNGKIRDITFQPNKVNVITGDSSTGKTEILDIIDYCLFASESKISEGIVNENIAWYGLLFNINDKKYTIARKSLTEGTVSDEYYFSSEGEVPNKVELNNTEGAIKSILETEFRIDSNVVIPYGSNLIKLGSKISLRYFFIFNTISVNIIENDTGVFFDKQNKARYRDALPRIFDLAVGIENIENILKKEKKAELESKLSKLKKKSRSISDKSNNFKNEQESIIKEAKEYSLIDPNLDLDSSLAELKNIISGVESETMSNDESDQIERDIYLKERKINNLKRFTTAYTSYKKNLKATEDSLKPIAFLKEKDADILKTSIFDDVINSFSSQLKQIRNACKTKTPIDKQVNDEIKLLVLRPRS